MWILGRTGVAVASEQGNFNGPHTLELNVMIFDPQTGALLDTSDAGCAINIGTIPTARGECVPQSRKFPDTPHTFPRCMTRPAVPSPSSDHVKNAGLWDQMNRSISSSGGSSISSW